MGFDSAINSSARIITPVLLGSVFAASRGKAFLCAATCVGAAFVIVVIRSFVVFRETRVKYFPIGISSSKSSNSTSRRC